MARQTIKLGKINLQESELTLVGGDLIQWLALKSTCSGKVNTTLYDLDGSISAMEHSADLYPIRDNEMLAYPRFTAYIYEDILEYQLSARGMKSIPMQREDLLQIIRGQIELSSEYNMRLSQLELPEELECAKQTARGILEKTAKLDFAYYENCGIRMRGADRK